MRLRVLVEIEHGNGEITVSRDSSYMGTGKPIEVLQSLLACVEAEAVAALTAKPPTR